MKVAIFPGSFNPIHNGHINIIQLAARSYDRLYIYVANNENKQYYVSLSNRFLIVKKLINYLGFDNVVVVKQNANEPTAFFAKRNKINYVIRGSRSEHITDYEARLADDFLSINEKLHFHYLTFKNDQNVSSTLIRDFIRENKSISELVPKVIEKDIKELWREVN